MATIFEKVPASGERCIILDPREGILYSFDFGDWRQIRMGAFVSMTNISENNGLTTAETISPNGLGRNQFYFGFKDSGLLIPTTTGSFFAGFTPSSNLTEVFDIVPTASNIGGNFHMVFSMSGSTYFGRTTFGSSFRIGTSGASYSDDQYGQFNCITINRNANYTGIVQFDKRDVNYQDVTLRNLRSLLDSTVTLNSIGFCASGYFPNTLNSAFIYSPFNQNRLRVHALVVEKYA